MLQVTQDPLEIQVLQVTQVLLEIQVQREILVQQVFKVGLDHRETKEYKELQDLLDHRESQENKDLKVSKELQGLLDHRVFKV